MSFRSPALDRSPCPGFAAARNAVRAGMRVAMLFAWLARPAAAADSFRVIPLGAASGENTGGARHLALLPTGGQSRDGIPFRVDSWLAVTGLEGARTGEFFPTEVRAIPVGGRVQRLHLLHGTLMADRDGAPLASVVFHYAGGRASVVRLGYGVHCRSMVVPRLEKRSELLDPNSRVAWSEADERRGVTVRLFQSALANPRPEDEVTSIDVVSLFSRATPFIVALTAEAPGAAASAPRPSLSRKVQRELAETSEADHRGEWIVRVRDGAAEGPVTNGVVSLSVTDDRETYFLGEHAVSAAGEARVPYPKRHAVAWQLWVRAPDRVPVVLSDGWTNRDALPRNYSVTLQPGRTAGGTVRDPAGRPVAGAEVVLCQATRKGSEPVTRFDLDRVVTGTNGAWSSRSLPAELGGVSVEVRHPGFRATAFQVAEPGPAGTTGVSPVPAPVDVRRTGIAPSGAGGTGMSSGRSGWAIVSRGPVTVSAGALLAGKAELVVIPAVLFSGVVLDPAGRPLPGLEVAVLSTSGDRQMLRTDAQGRFSGRRDDSGAVSLLVAAAGFSPLQQDVVLGPGGPPIELRLAPAVVLKGRVVDRGGKPVEGARVRADEWYGAADLLRFQAVTDAAGGFAWTGAPPDQVTFLVAKTNYSTGRHSFSGAMRDITITLSALPGISGRVRDADTGEPVDSFFVVPGRKYSGDSGINWDRSDGVRGSAGEYVLRLSSYYFQPEAVVMVEAPGYLPAVSRPMAGVDAHTSDFVLKKGSGLRGRVVGPDGAPVAGVTLLQVERGDAAVLDQTGILRGQSGSSDLIRSDREGRFEFTARLHPAGVVACHDQGFALVSAASLEQTGRVMLRPWARVTGVSRVGNAGDGEEQWIRVQRETLEGAVAPAGAGDDGVGFSYLARVEPEAGGGFVVDRVPPGDHRIAVEYRFKDDRYGEAAVSHGVRLTLEPGAATNLVLGGTGRRVTGQVRVTGGTHADIDWRRDVHRLVLRLPPLPEAAATPRVAPGVLGRFFGGLVVESPPAVSPELLRERARAERSYVLLVDTNGQFHADHVPPGTYDLTIDVSDPGDEYYNRRSIGSTTRTVVVPSDAAAAVNAPLPVGDVPLTIRPRLKLGREVPAFTARTLDGSEVKLADYRGKPLLLSFWGLSVGYSSYDFQMLKELQAGHGAAGRLAILGCNMDADSQSAARMVQSQRMTWPQVYLGDWNQTPVPGIFGLNGSSGCVLIDAEGRLASAVLRGSNIRTVVNQAVAAE